MDVKEAIHKMRQATVLLRPDLMPVCLLTFYSEEEDTLVYSPFTRDGMLTEVFYEDFEELMEEYLLLICAQGRQN